MPSRLPNVATPRERPWCKITSMTTWNQSGGDFSELWGETLQELYDEMSGWNLDEVGRCSWRPVLDLSWGDDQLVTGGTLTVDIEVLVGAWVRGRGGSGAVGGGGD